MKPVLAAWTQKRRNAFFAPILLGILLVAFLAVGFPTSDPFVAALVAVPLAIAGAWALVGWPKLPRKDARPLVDPHTRPYLFFPVALLGAIFLYPVYGTLLTKAALPTKWLAPASMLLSLVTASIAGYVLFGFPRFWTHAIERYRALPADRRPFLFFPIFAVTFLVLYIGLGVGTTQALARFTDQVVLLLNIQVLLLLPVCILLAALVAYLLVGFPKPQRAPLEYLPKVPGRRRPHAFALTFLLAGLPLTVAVGAVLTYAAKRDARGEAFLPDPIVLPLALLLGYSLSLGVAAAVWGTPQRWRRFEDYRPGLSPRARIGAAGAAGLGTALTVVVLAGLAGVDIFWGLLAGAALGIVIGLIVSGTHRRIAARRKAESLIPDLPDRMKSVVLLTTWFVLAIVIFSVLTYTLPELVAWNLFIAIFVGLAIAFVLVEEPFLKEAWQDRKAARQKRKAWERHRKETLARGPETDETQKQA